MPDTYKVTIKDSSIAGQVVIGDRHTIVRSEEAEQHTPSWSEEGPDVVISGSQVTTIPPTSIPATPPPLAPQSKPRPKGQGYDFRALAAKQLQQRGHIKGGIVRPR
ncbi:MAG TPA: hypothetical protein VNG90_04420 [Candidatus Acidoferrum sp.]|nr:hypothetical protein [Candidatus Acidoferrum sp.]